MAEAEKDGGLHHLRMQISRCHVSVAITQDNALGLFAKLLMDSVPHGRCEGHRQRRGGMITQHGSMHAELKGELALFALDPMPVQTLRRDA